MKNSVPFLKKNWNHISLFSITRRPPTLVIVVVGSVYSVVAVAVERYYTICRPFKYNMVSIM